LAIGAELFAGFAGSRDRSGGWRGRCPAGGGHFGVNIACVYQALIRRRLTGGLNLDGYQHVIDGSAVCRWLRRDRL